MQTSFAKVIPVFGRLSRISIKSSPAKQTSRYSNRRASNRVISLVGAIVLGLFLAGQVTAQTFKTLYSFTNGTDGGNPQSGVIVSNNTLYGTTYYQSLTGSGTGTVFKMNLNGSGIATLHSFTYADGAGPQAGLLMAGNMLYGTASGGFSGNGTVFAVSTDGSFYTNVWVFSGGSDGAHPYGDLVLSTNAVFGTTNTMLYGTTAYGGNNSEGTVFGVQTDGSIIFTFESFPTGGGGDNPKAGLVLSGNTLYGTTYLGTLFAVNDDYSGFANLHNFSSSDGVGTVGDLILSSNILYGTASTGGNSYGTVFKINTSGGGFAVLHTFTTLNGGTNNDGAMPFCNLVLFGNTLYGTTELGGLYGKGTVFAVNIDGTGFTNLHNFNPQNNQDGANPHAGLTLFGNTLYGTTFAGGSVGYGTVFSLSLQTIRPQLTMTHSLNSLILAWPTNTTGFNLQSSTNIGFTNWSAVSPPPVIVNGQNTVTNTISGGQKFYRLAQ